MRSLAGLPYAAVERTLGAWRARARHQPVPPTPSFGAPQHVEVVESALAAGALEALGDALEALCAELPQLPTAAVGRAVRVAVDALLMLGERPRALELAAAHRYALEASGQGVGRLECLGIACPLRCRDGKWNLLGASLRLQGQSFGAAELSRQLKASPWMQLRTPELGLLFFSALWRHEPQRALACLGGFARAHGLREPWQLDARSESRELLARLRGGGVARSAGPVVSVVVAARDAGTTLGYALDSLLAQTHAPLEILVGDDGSRDETAQVMRRYAGEPRVRLFQSEANQGAYNLRNQLAAQARGELLTFHDADDWALPGRIAAQVSALQKTHARGSIANLLRVSPTGEIRFFKNQRASRLSRVSLLLRRELFAELGGFRSARVGADFELAEKLSTRFGQRALVRSKAPLMLSRHSAGSATTSRGTESAEDGYLAPARRAYSQLVFDCYRAGRHVPDELFEQRLRETGNWQAPTSLRPL